MKNKKGFTLAELLVVVAIIGVLVAISIPVFNSQLEKSRRAVDIANARSIAAELVSLANMGEIEIPANDNKNGVWVLVTKEGNAPLNYKMDDKTVFFGADRNVTIKGVKHTANWDVQDNTLAEEMKEFATLEVKSTYSVNKKLDKIGGWDWYVVQVYYDNNTKDYAWIIFSGENGKHGAIDENKDSNIAKWMSRQ